MNELIDPFKRKIEYVRLSVTDRCNYRCFYCMPSKGVEWEQRNEFLSYDELTRLIRLFTELGVTKVRLTGGEPLVRKDISLFIKQLNGLPHLDDLSMSSNAHLLAEHAQDLYQAGISRINISIDSLDPKIFKEITKTGDLNKVIAGIDAAILVGMTPVKLNMVIMKGVNDHEIEPMFNFAKERGANLRLIETMPIGIAGINSQKLYISADEILKRLKLISGENLIPIKTNIGAGPARHYQVGSSGATIGVISAMSRHFCDSCNRVRLTAKGDLVLCLGQEDRISLAAPLRENATDEEIKAMIIDAINHKPKSHDFNQDQQRVELRHMSALGG